MSDTIKVKPQDMRNTAKEFGDTAQKIQNITNQILGVGDTLTGNTFSGDVAQKYNLKLRGMVESVGKLIEDVKDYETKLEEIANDFGKTISDSEGDVEALTDDPV